MFEDKSCKETYLVISTLFVKITIIPLFFVKHQTASKKPFLRETENSSILGTQKWKLPPFIISYNSGRKSSNLFVFLPAKSPNRPYPYCLNSKFKEIIEDKSKNDFTLQVPLSKLHKGDFSAFKTSSPTLGFLKIWKVCGFTCYLMYVLGFDSNIYKCISFNLSTKIFFFHNKSVILCY